MKASPHRHTTAEVDLVAIKNNIKKFKKYLGPKPQIWGVVKANAYGHGAVAVSQAIEKEVEGFCVSNLDEALELRENLVTKPVLILSGIVPETVNLALQHDITLTVPSLAWIKLVVAQDIDLTKLKVHVAVDSGMGRIGVREVEEANAIIDTLDRFGITFEGIFTHFATADEADEEKFKLQQERFSAFLNSLRRKPRYVHSTNTASALWHTHQVQDIERLGISMYGLNPSGKTLPLPFELEPALSLKTELTHVKQVQSGETLGYGATYETSESTWIGTVSLGYADGWTRAMQGFHVLVDGKYCEIVGRVSMDQMMIKLDQAYPLGTVVTLIGRDGVAEISATDVADWRGTINYEVLCLISDRVVRIYKQ
ncbi:alanine racemase [Lactococcus taiwanensis]|uniref:Alanine racemase n=1 Tax=Lactococcus taiwanensis TaxID=1151742 RepID=A0AA45KJ97_9LACT|nr:alanine racemase [Lactococcus taiwanensis]QSE77523.1 alanine racemase [Lactococcus taiwanensis]